MQWVRGITGFAMLIVPGWLGAAGHPWLWVIATAAFAAAVASLTDPRSLPLYQRQGFGGVATVLGITFATMLVLQTAIWGGARLIFG